MKKRLLLLGLLTSFVGFSQVSKYDSDCYGFEYTSINYKNALVGNAVEAMTQVAGFTQSSEQAHGGTYSMMADFTSSVPGTTPKTQGWRTQVNDEADIWLSSASNYTIRAWIYTTATTSTVAKVALTGGTATQNLSLNLDGYAAGQWHEFTKSFEADAGYLYDDVAETGVPLTFNINFTNMEVGSKIYIDDVDIVQTSTLSKSYSKIEGASVDASNGTITVTGANLDAVYSITGQQVGPTNLASGVYIVKISKGDRQDSVKVIM